MSRVVWICDGCGKVSGAKKRLTMHKDWREMRHPDPEDDAVIGREQFYCGVFVRHVAHRDDHLAPARHDDRRGKPTGQAYEYMDDPNVGIAF